MNLAPGRKGIYLVMSLFCCFLPTFVCQWDRSVKCTHLKDNQKNKRKWFLSVSSSRKWNSTQLKTPSADRNNTLSPILHYLLFNYFLVNGIHPPKTPKRFFLNLFLFHFLSDESEVSTWLSSVWYRDIAVKNRNVLHLNLFLFMFLFYFSLLFFRIVALYSYFRFVEIWTWYGFWKRKPFQIPW